MTPNEVTPGKANGTWEDKSFTEAWQFVRGYYGWAEPKAFRRDDGMRVMTINGVEVGWSKKSVGAAVRDAAERVGNMGTQPPVITTRPAPAPQPAISAEGAEPTDREKKLMAAIQNLESSLSAMTEDRDLWQDAHGDDCPYKDRAETAEAELARLRLACAAQEQQTETMREARDQAMKEAVRVHAALLERYSAAKAKIAGGPGGNEASPNLMPLEAEIGREYVKGLTAI